MISIEKTQRSLGFRLLLPLLAALQIAPASVLAMPATASASAAAICFTSVADSYPPDKWQYERYYEPAWKALLGNPSTRVSFLRQELFPMVVNYLREADRTEDLSVPGLQARAVTYVAHLRDVLFPSRPTSWMRVLLSILCLGLYRFGSSHNILVRTATDNLSDAATSLVPVGGREWLTTTFFRSSPTAVYSEGIRQINKITGSAGLSDKEKVLALSDVLGPLMVVSNIEKDFPRLVETAWDNSPLIRAIDPGILESTVIYTRELVASAGRLEAADEALPAESAELLLRVWLRWGARPPVEKSIVEGWRTLSRATGANVASTEFFVTTELFLEEIFRRFLSLNERTLYVSDLTVALRDLESSQQRDKVSTVQRVLSFVRQAGHESNPVGEIRRRLNLGESDFGELKRLLLLSKGWYQADLLSRFAHQAVAQLADVSETWAEFDASRNTLAKDVFSDDPPRVIAVYRLMRKVEK